MSVLQNFQTRLEAKRGLSPAEASDLFNVLRRATDVIAIARILDAWATKGYTSDELAACAKILRDNCVKVETKHEKFIDIVGTGGSKAKVFNVSTAAAFVIAGAGLPVAKHGNRAASSKTGSADALSNLGVNIVAETDLARKCLNEIGISFMFAPKFHNLTKELATARKSLGKPTIFNLLGPLANPANAPYQLIGIWNKDFMKPMAEAIAKLGTKKTWIVHGEDGLDEITLNGKTNVAEITDGDIRCFDIHPNDFGLPTSSLSGFENISPETSAEIIRKVLNDSADHKSMNIVLVNAAAALSICNAAGDVEQAIKLARSCIETGAALRKLNSLIEETNG